MVVIESEARRQGWTGKRVSQRHCPSHSTFVLATPTFCASTSLPYAKSRSGPATRPTRHHAPPCVLGLVVIHILLPQLMQPPTRHLTPPPLTPFLILQPGIHEAYEFG